MTTNDVSMPTDKQSPGEPTVTLAPLPRTHTHGAREPGLGERIEDLKGEIESILKDTTWPWKSKTAANDLLNTVKSSPDISNNTTGISYELLNLFRQYSQSLEDVHARLEDASSNLEMKKWERLERIQSSASNRSSKCTLLFRTCQQDVSKVVGSIDERLDNERKKELAASGISSGAVIKTLELVESMSRTVPGAGKFIAAAAKVGLAFVKMIQTMDNNDDLAKDLESETDKLAKLLKKITETPKADQRQQIGDDVDDLRRELQRLHAKVEGWNSLDRFKKASNARDHGEALKGLQGTIQTAMEEMQLMGVNTHSIAIQLVDSEVKGKTRHLLNRLGDGQYGAQRNSIENVTCLPGTRVEILGRIQDWIRGPSTPVLWLRGMAGRGKSAIASTVVETWKYRASCAIFHFRRGQNTLDTRVVCALARQLAGSLVTEVRNAVLDSVRENEDIADERLEEQFRKLFVASLAKLHNQPHPIIIAVDALDECDNQKDVTDFIHLIEQHSSSFPANVKFLLTSRPEVQYLRVFERNKWRVEDLDTAPDVSNDLWLFIQHAFQQIRVTNSDVPDNWPSLEDIDTLVEMSQGLFQWVRTAITYVSNGSPVGRLKGLLRRPSKWSGLDDLYNQILSKAFDSLRLDAERVDLLHRVLGTLVVAPYPISLKVIAGLYGDNKIFDEIDQADIILFLRDDILADLNSLLFIPTSSAEAIRLRHTSIRDLLVNEYRSPQKPYFINVIHHHGQVAGLCLATMLRDLKENICNLSDPSKPASEVQDIAEHRVSKALLYCCRSWSIHLTEGVQWPTRGTDTTTVKLADFEVFSKEKIMYWLEVMSLATVTKDAIMMAKSVHQWLVLCPKAVLESDSLATLWNDVQQFIDTFSEPIEFGPLHIYMSALPYCPIETELGRQYRKLAKVRTIHGLQASTAGLPQSVEGHGDGTESPAPGLTTGSSKWVKFVTVVPSQHGRFKIHADIPPICGGFSDVWRCDAKLSDGRVIVAAVKKFRAVRIARDADASTVTNKLLKRLTQELDIWMTLQHPHISPLLGFVLEGHLCIISPWYTNGNVTEYIGRHPEVDRIKLMSDVASGLAYLHTRVPPVVHGDMKADNVLIDDAGNAVIIDFGLSAIVEDDPTLASSLAATSLSLQDAGNARWMAPELLMEEGCTRSSSTDVYSFGCVALQIYTGEIPFKDVPTFRIIYALIQGQKPLAKREDYPTTDLSSPSLDWFYDLLVSCWDGIPTARPSMVDVESKLRMGVLSSGVSGTCT